MLTTSPSALTPAPGAAPSTPDHPAWSAVEVACEATGWPRRHAGDLAIDRRALAASPDCAALWRLGPYGTTITLERGSDYRSTWRMELAAWRSMADGRLFEGSRFYLLTPRGELRPLTTPRAVMDTALQLGIADSYPHPCKDGWRR